MRPMGLAAALCVLLVTLLPVAAAESSASPAADVEVRISGGNVTVRAAYAYPDAAALRARLAPEGGAIGPENVTRLQDAERDGCLSGEGGGPVLTIDGRRADRADGTLVLTGVGTHSSASGPVRGNASVTCVFHLRSDVPAHELTLANLSPGASVSVALDDGLYVLATPVGHAPQDHGRPERDFWVTAPADGRVAITFGAPGPFRFDVMGLAALAACMGAALLAFILCRAASWRDAAPFVAVLAVEALVSLLFATFHFTFPGTLPGFERVIDGALAVLPVVYLAFVESQARQVEQDSWVRSTLLGAALLLMLVAWWSVATGNPTVEAVSFTLLYGLVLVAVLGYAWLIHRRVPRDDQGRRARALAFVKLFGLQYLVLLLSFAIYGLVRAAHACDARPWWGCTPYDSLGDGLGVHHWSSWAAYALGVPHTSTHAGGRFVIDFFQRHILPLVTLLFLPFVARALFRERLIKMQDKWRERLPRVIQVLTAIPLGGLAAAIVTFYAEKAAQGPLGGLAGGGVGVLVTYIVASSKKTEGFAVKAANFATADKLDKP